MVMFTSIEPSCGVEEYILEQEIMLKKYIDLFVEVGVVFIGNDTNSYIFFLIVKLP